MKLNSSNYKEHNFDSGLSVEFPLPVKKQIVKCIKKYGCYYKLFKYLKLTHPLF